MAMDEEKVQETEVGCGVSDGGGSDCCSEIGGGGKAWKSWKTAVFVLVLLAAGAVAAHSFLTNGNAPRCTPGTTWNVDSGGVVSPCGQTDPAAEVSGAGGEPSKGSSVVCGVSLASMGELDKMAVGKKAVFILLAGDNEEPAASASAQVEAMVSKLSAKGESVGAFTLKKDAPGYDQLLKQFSVQKLPCVVVAGRGSGASAVSGEITEAKLASAFVKASVPASCGPRSGPGCCPKAGASAGSK